LAAQRLKEWGFALAINILVTDSKESNAVWAKLNSYYAYLVHIGYASPYRLIRGHCVAGAESIYTWVRIYRVLDRYQPIKP